jgi:hypothetical protein
MKEKGFLLIVVTNQGLAGALRPESCGKRCRQINRELEARGRPSTTSTTVPTTKKRGLPLPQASAADAPEAWPDTGSIHPAIVVYRRLPADMEAGRQQGCAPAGGT